MAILNDSIHQSICAPLSPTESHVAAIDAATGALVQWGSGSYAWPSVSDPHSFSAIVDRNKVVVKKDGTIVFSGPSSTGGVSGLETLTNVEAHQFAKSKDGMGYDVMYSLVLHKDGTLSTVPATGTDIPDVSGLSGVRKIAANTNSDYQAVILFDDGTVDVLLNAAKTTLTLGPSSGSFANPVVDISVGRNFAHYLLNDGTVDEQVWSNASKVFNGEDSGAAINAFGKPIVQVSCGGQHAAALFSDGTVGCIGSNSAGQCDVPVGLANVVYLFAAQDYNIAVKADGSAVHWGDSLEGQDAVPVNPVKAGLLASSLEGEINASLSFVADFTADLTVAGDIVADLSFLAELGGAAGLTGSISSELGFSQSLSGEVVKAFGAVSVGLDFTVRASGFYDWVALLPPVQSQVVYSLTITGAADGLDDMVAPISSWQATLREGTRSDYLQAVIPAAQGIAKAISDRANGTLIVRKGYRFDDGSERSEPIAESDFSTIRVDRGGSNYTITVSGYMTSKSAQSATRNLSKIQSINIDNGTYRVRAGIDLFLRPGMTATADSEAFRVSYINFYASQAGQFCEVGGK